MIGRIRPPEPEGVLALHASAVAVNGSALLFLGPSGTGKSTMQRLMGDVARPLADDRIYLHGKDGTWCVADAEGRLLRGPLREAEVEALHGPPLRAAFRLYRARAPRLELINSLQLCCHLVEAFFEIPWQQGYTLEEKRAAFSTLAILAREVEGYHLHFERSPWTVNTLLERLVSQTGDTSQQ